MGSTRPRGPGAGRRPSAAVSPKLGADLGHVWKISGPGRRLHAEIKLFIDRQSCFFQDVQKHIARSKAISRTYQGRPNEGHGLLIFQNSKFHLKYNYS